MLVSGREAGLGYSKQLLAPPVAFESCVLCSSGSELVEAQVFVRWQEGYFLLCLPDYLLLHMTNNIPLCLPF